MRSIIARRPLYRIAEARTFTTSTLAVASGIQGAVELVQAGCLDQDEFNAKPVRIGGVPGPQRLSSSTLRGAAIRRATGTISMRSSSRFSSIRLGCVMSSFLISRLTNAAGWVALSLRHPDLCWPAVRWVLG